MLGGVRGAREHAGEQGARCGTGVRGVLHLARWSGAGDTAEDVGVRVVRLCGFELPGSIVANGLAADTGQLLSTAVLTMAGARAESRSADLV